MSVDIYELKGDSMELVGEWNEESGWIRGLERFSFPHDDEYTTEMMLERFDGPTLFAQSQELEKATTEQNTFADFDVVEVEDAERSDEEKSDDDSSGERVVVDSPSDAPNDKVVHVDVDDEGEVSESYYYK